MGATRSVSVRAATHDSSVHVSRKAGWYGWSWNVASSRPAALGELRERDDVLGSRACGVMKVPKVSSWP